MKMRALNWSAWILLAPFSWAGGGVVESPQAGLGGSGLTGEEVALDGDTLVIGTKFNGNVAVYVGAGAAWTLQQEIPNQGGDFGRTVALEGDRLVIGARNAPGGGSAHVFERQGTTWTETAAFTGVETEANDDFGWSVALSGERVLVGSPFADAPVGRGAAYVFELQGSTWVQEARLTSASGLVWWSKDLDLEGDRAVIENEVYVRQGTSWVLEEELPNDPDPDGVSLDGDGCALGFQGLDEVQIFRRAGGTWTLEETLTTEVNVGMPRFGHAVELHGNLLAVTDNGDDSLVGNGGSAYLFERQAGVWTELSKVTPPAGYLEFGGVFGSDVAVDEQTFVVGQGNLDAAHAYAVTDEPSTYCTALVNSQGCVPVIDVAGSASLGDPTPLVTTAREVLNQKNGLFFYGTLDAANIPFLGGTLCAQPPLVRTPIQSSGGSPPPDDCTGAFLFDLKAWALSGVDSDLVVGADQYGQFWSRDPLAAEGVSLTDAVHVQWCP